MAAKAQIQKTERPARNPEADRKNLDLAISGINKQFGPGALMRLGEATKMEIDVISTGSIAIDIALQLRSGCRCCDGEFHHGFADSDLFAVLVLHQHVDQDEA